MRREPSPLADASEARSLLRLAGPVLAAQLGMFAMGLVDSVMVGHVSGDALAAIALGHLVSFAVLGSAMGFVTGIEPVIAQALGAGDGDGARRGVQRGILLALLVSVPSIAVLQLTEPVLHLVRQPERVVPVTAAYVRVVSASTPAFLLFVVARITLQALHRVRPVVAAVVIGNVLNAFLNWLLVFGNAGCPRLGPVGAAWGTLAVRWALVGVVLVLGWSALGPRLRPVLPDSLRWRPLLRLVRIGLPIGLQFLVEIGMFGAVALFMGWFGAEQLAAHHVAVQLASLSFMVPMSLSTAVAVRVGWAVGRDDPPAARRSSAVAILSAIAVMSAAAAVFVTAPEWLARIYTRERAVVAMAAGLIRIAAVFQVVDGLQVVAVGILRGLGDTRTPLVVNVAGFWFLGIPLSLFLGFRTDRGAPGLWWGLCCGLFAVAAVLLLRVRRLLAGRVARLVVDDPPPA